MPRVRLGGAEGVLWVHSSSLCGPEDRALDYASELKSQRLYLYVGEQLAAEIRAAAARDDREVSEWLRVAAKERLARETVNGG